MVVGSGDFQMPFATSRNSTKIVKKSSENGTEAKVSKTLISKKRMQTGGGKTTSIEETVNNEFRHKNGVEAKRNTSIVASKSISIGGNRDGSIVGTSGTYDAEFRKWMKTTTKTKLRFSDDEDELLHDSNGSDDSFSEYTFRFSAPTENHKNSQSVGVARKKPNDDANALTSSNSEIGPIRNDPVNKPKRITQRKSERQAERQPSVSSAKRDSATRYANFSKRRKDADGKLNQRIKLNQKDAAPLDSNKNQLISSLFGRRVKVKSVQRKPKCRSNLKANAKTLHLNESPVKGPNTSASDHSERNKTNIDTKEMLDLSTASSVKEAVEFGTTVNCLTLLKKSKKKSLPDEEVSNRRIPKRNASLKSKDQSIAVEADDSVNRPRRSKRVRLPVLEFWRNERVVYRKNMKTLDFIAEVDKGTQQEWDSNFSPGTVKIENYHRNSMPEIPELKPSILPSPPHGITVIDPDTQEEVIMDCVKTKHDYVYINEKGMAAEKTDPYVMCRPIFQKSFSSGIIYIRPLQSKGPHVAPNSTVMFWVLKGQVQVVIDRTCFELSSKGSFFVPEGNYYTIRNTLERQAELLYFQFLV